MFWNKPEAPQPSVIFEMEPDLHRDSVFILKSASELTPAAIERIEENWKSFWEMDGGLAPKMMVLGREFDFEVAKDRPLRQAGLMRVAS